MQHERAPPFRLQFIETPSRARDYYDLWRILSDFSSLLEGIDLDELLQRKSAHRGVTYASLADFFTTTKLEEEAHWHWSGTLGAFVAELPGSKQVLAELKELVPNYFRGL